MQYFDTLPKVIVTDKNLVSTLMTNLMARNSILPKILKNPMVYYKYDIQEGDTPEIIAHKYYNDSYRYWIVLFANQIIDPLWNWPLSYNSFNRYISDKYPTGGSIDAYSDVHHYEKIITQVDVDTQTTTSETIIIDEDTYNSLLTGTQSYTLPTGMATVTTDKRAVSYYDYESELNESRRTINILNVSYVDQLENEFKSLMAQ